MPYCINTKHFVSIQSLYISKIQNFVGCINTKDRVLMHLFIISIHLSIGPMQGLAVVKSWYLAKTCWYISTCIDTSLNVSIHSRQNCLLFRYILQYIDTSGPFCLVHGIFQFLHHWSKYSIWPHYWYQKSSKFIPGFVFGPKIGFKQNFEVQMANDKGYFMT